MNRALFTIGLLAVLAHSSMAQTVKNTLGRRGFDRLCRAAVDISMTCYGNPGNAIGIVGDRNGSILKTLRSSHFIPVALVDGDDDEYIQQDNENLYKLHVFIFAVHSPMHLGDLLFALTNYIWWNSNAKILVVDMRPELNKQCTSTEMFMWVTTNFAILNAQFICYDLAKHEDAIIIYSCNPYMPQAPREWIFVWDYTITTKKLNITGYVYGRMYRPGGQSCKSINFPKTSDIAGSPLHFVTPIRASVLQRHEKIGKENRSHRSVYSIVAESWYDEQRWFIDNLAIALNATEVIVKDFSQVFPGISLNTLFMSSFPKKMGRNFEIMILRRKQWPIYAVTQHTGHMTQLDKIVSVVDRKSRIGIGFVYFISFLFFKYFLRQAVVPALLNIVRLTSNTGLTTLPQNVAPTLYLTSLFIFVVTFQAIFTGNLAMLLTTTIPYRNVQTKEDISKLGYTLYLPKDTLTKINADPVFDGCVVEIPTEEKCIHYVLRDPLAVCASNHIESVYYADKWKLHVSSVPIIYEYAYHMTSNPNILRRRMAEILVIYFKAGIEFSNPNLEKLRLQYVEDDEVKKNTYRRVMTLADLRFAFVILGFGLLCSFVCFIWEIVILRICLKYTKRRNRVRVRSAWGVTAERRSWFRSLNCRFNLRRLFSNRR